MTVILDRASLGNIAPGEIQSGSITLCGNLGLFILNLGTGSNRVKFYQIAYSGLQNAPCQLTQVRQKPSV